MNFMERIQTKINKYKSSPLKKAQLEKLKDSILNLQHHHEIYLEKLMRDKDFLEKRLENYNEELLKNIEIYEGQIAQDKQALELVLKELPAPREEKSKKDKKKDKKQKKKDAKPPAPEEPEAIIPPEVPEEPPEEPEPEVDVDPLSALTLPKLKGLANKLSIEYPDVQSADTVIKLKAVADELHIGYDAKILKADLTNLIKTDLINRINEVTAEQ